MDKTSFTERKYRTQAHQHKIIKGDNMRIENIIEGIALKTVKGLTAQEIKTIGFDPDQPTDLFVNLKTDAAAAQANVERAIKNGAQVVLTQTELPLSIPQVVAQNVRNAFALSACNFYENPAKKLKIIAITGTNGKTTSTYIIKSILEKAGYKVGLIGTNQNMIGDKVVPAHLTTPDPMELQELLSKMQKSGCDYVVMEVSAHALYFNKVDGIQFECSIFTNLTQDHLDFFGNMQDYAQAKAQLFKKDKSKNCIFNVDDDFGHLFARFCNADRVISFGIDNPSDVFAVNIDVDLTQSQFFVNAFDDIAEFCFHIGGKYNVYNVLGSIACCHALNIDMSKIVEGVAAVTGVDGRYNTYKSPKGYQFVIDYAHTPDGLENLLSSVKELTPHRLIAVFGCGGNRDATKRPIMGEIAGKIADISILTSDNPRYENPMSIIDQIEKGTQKVTANYIKVETRQNAIEYASKIARDGDVIVIAGKGQEPYQEIKGVKHHFSDKEIVLDIIDRETSRQTLQVR